jgi:hypothetical protein
VASARVRPNGRLRLGFKLPPLRRRDRVAIFTTDSNLSGSRLIVPHRRSEPNLALVRTGHRVRLGFTLTGCDNDGRL